MRKFHLSALSLLAALVFVTGCGDDKTAGPVEAPVENQKEAVDLDAKVLAPALRVIAWKVSDAEMHGLIMTQAINASLVAADAQFTQEEKEHYSEHVAALTATRDALNLKLVASDGDADSIAVLNKELDNFRAEADKFEAEVVKSRDDFAAKNPNAAINNVRSTNDLQVDSLSPELAQRLVLAKSFKLDEDTQVDRDAVADRADLQDAVAAVDTRLLNARKAIRTGANDAKTLQNHVRELDKIRGAYADLKTTPTPEAIKAAEEKQAALIVEGESAITAAKAKLPDAEKLVVDKKAPIAGLVEAEEKAEKAHLEADKAKEATATALVKANETVVADTSDANKEAAVKALASAEAAVKTAEDAVKAKEAAVAARTAAEAELQAATDALKAANDAVTAAEKALAEIKANPVPAEAPVAAPAK